MAGLVALTLSAIGIFSTLPVFWTFPAAMLTGTAAAGGIALVNAIGNVGGFLGPSMIGALKESTGGYGLSLWALGAALAFSGLIVLAIGTSPTRSAISVQRSR